ncbi:MAG TPA: TonB-dependent receptor [Steroidobacteraceae bacterium]|nr:TonB-dependent receptor [Steroidobacteraceae bacterium]
MTRIQSGRPSPRVHARTAISRCVSALIGGGLLAGTAWGQSAPATDNSNPSADTGGLQEVVVTAQFHNENLQQTPLAITAITGDMLTQRSATSLSDVANFAPNVILQPTYAGTGNAMRAQIRGVGQTDFDPALDPGVGVYIDDVYFPTLTGSDFALVDLDRVEILRGPQGTLSGMNSLGGSVKLYSKKATGEDDGYISGTYGSLDRVEFHGSGDFSLIPDTLFFRLTGVTRHNNGYVTLEDYGCSHPDDPYVISGAYPRAGYTADCKTGSEGGTDYTALRGSFRWLPAKAVEVNLIFDATQDNSESTATTLLGTPASPLFAGTAPIWYGAPYDSRFIPTNPYTSYANFLDPGLTYSAINAAGAAGTKNGPFYANPNNTMNSWGTSATIDWTINDNLSVKSISAYRHYNSTFGDDNSASPVPLILEEADLKNHQASEELRLNGIWGSFLNWTLGGIYFDQTTAYASREDDPSFGIIYGGLTTPTFDFLGDDAAHTKTHAAFFNAGLHFTDALTLNTGVRYTSETKVFTYENENVDGVTPFYPIPLNGSSGEYSGSHVDYRVDLDYQWTPTLMTYAEVSTGFKGGGVTPRPYNAEQVISFGPETLKSYELGLKSEWFNHSLRANLAAFYELYDDYQAAADQASCVDKNGNSLVGTPYDIVCGEYQNVGNAKGKGAEAELDYQLYGLTVDASFSYVDLYVTSSRATALVVGQELPDIGKIRTSLGIQYQVSFGDYGSITPRVDAIYTPASCGDITCDADVNNSPYTLVNARLTYAFPSKKWTASFEVTNLTDKLYYLSKVNTGVGYLDGQIGAPRLWALTLRRDF